MSIYTGHTFKDVQIRVDGHQFDHCTFNNCTIEYCGEHLLQLNDCHFNGCRWFFNGPAGETLRFLAALYANGDPGLQRMVKQTLDNVTNGVAPALGESESRPRAI
jgi:hypothetical protein